MADAILVLLALESMMPGQVAFEPNDKYQMIRAAVVLLSLQVLHPVLDAFVAVSVRQIQADNRRCRVHEMRRH